ncbi:hypothetical protein COOONC_14728 [Cooperia oncophora]
MAGVKSVTHYTIGSGLRLVTGSAAGQISRWFLAIVVTCSGQVAWPVQSFSPEVARLLQAALSSIAAADLPSIVTVEPSSARSPSPPEQFAFPQSIPLSLPEGPREKLVPVVERPAADSPRQILPPATLFPMPVPSPAHSEPSITPPQPQPPAPAQQPPVTSEVPFYLTAATRLRLPSPVYQHPLPVPYLTGNANMLFFAQSPSPSLAQQFPTQIAQPAGSAPSHPPVPEIPTPTESQPPQDPQVAIPTQPQPSPLPAPSVTEEMVLSVPLFAPDSPSQSFPFVQRRRVL